MEIREIERRENLGKRHSLYAVLEENISLLNRTQSGSAYYAESKFAKNPNSLYGEGVGLGCGGGGLTFLMPSTNLLKS